ncbi:MAG TPA: metallophosphoesterase [Candidatus Limnocylindria bacterium]|jgi:Icc-related predicted phosphoesterase|nr:metallophosphoesterase [Candidatus Limnocylindria bacterium]HTL67237.1 metallophosphoesterase [Lacunisphaera sp.]
MRLIHYTDLHYRKSWFRHVARAAQHCDAIAITGDFLDSQSVTPAVDQVAWITRWIRRFPGPRLLIESGNHDQERDDLPRHLQHWVADLDLPHVYTDGDITALGSTTVQCVGWGEQPQPCGPRSIALMHCPPTGAHAAIEAESGRDFGDYELALTLLRGVQSPDLILSGHVHRPRRWFDRMGPNSLSFNPGRCDAPHPPHIIIDLNVRTAEFVRHNRPNESVSF